MYVPYSRREKLAGLFLILGLLIIVFSIVLINGGREWFTTYHSYFALYKEGYGLEPGVKVKFLRTDIGKVTKLELMPNNKVKVHMEITAEYAERIKGDSSANIESPTLIGSEYIDIIPGSFDSVEIPPGGQIPSQERKTIDDILKALDLETKLKQVEETMTNVVSLTEQLQNPQGPLLGTMDNVRVLTSTIAQGEGSVGRLIKNDEVYIEIYKILNSVEVTTGNIAKSSADITSTLPPILERIDNMSGNLESASRSVPDLTRTAREGLRDVNQVIDAAKKNILIRGKLTPAEEPSAISRSVRDR